MHVQPVVGDSQKPKYEPFITHNRGTLKKIEWGDESLLVNNAWQTYTGVLQ